MLFDIDCKLFNFPIIPDLIERGIFIRFNNTVVDGSKLALFMCVVTLRCQTAICA